MRNITVSVDDETYRRSRIHAAELDTSVSALVREYLQNLTTGRALAAEASPQEVERRRRMLNEVIDDIRASSPGFSAQDRLSREELYDSARARAEDQEDRDVQDPRQA